MKRYYQSLEGRERLQVDRKEVNAPGHENAIIDLLDSKTAEQSSSRRDFLKLWGFSIGAAALAASCKRPVQKAIPLLIRPETVTPGMSKFYASTYFDGQEYASLLVKTRDGRPIKIEANDRSGFGAKGTTARVQASVLGLYDDARYKHPLKNNTRISWEDADREIESALKKISSQKGRIVFLSSTIISPSTLNLIERFRRQYPGTEVVWYDAGPGSAIIEANIASFGKRAIPQYHFDKAACIVSFGADFLGTWLSPAEYAAQYARGRDLSKDDPRLSRHYQYESVMSVTGSNADQRVKIKPSEERLILANLYNLLARELGAERYRIPNAPLDMDSLARELLDHQGNSLVVSGSADPGTQQVVNEINALLGNYGKTIDLSRTLNIRYGVRPEMETLLNDMNEGKVNALITHGVNPAFDHPHAGRFTGAVKKLDLHVSLAVQPDETSALADYICPDHHYLESWNDANPKTGYFSLAQPVIHPLFNTRQAQESLMAWSGIKGDFHLLIRDHWETKLFPMQSEYSRFEDFWNHSLQDGIFEPRLSGSAQPQIRHDSTQSVMDATGSTGKPGLLEAVVYENVAMGTGIHTNNPWLMELPDPVTKLCWENAACFSVKTAASLGIQTGQLVRVNEHISLPALVQPGQADDTVAIAAGYGRTVSGKVALGAGANPMPLLAGPQGSSLPYAMNVNVETQDEMVALALTQEHHSMEGREIVRETTLEKYKEDPHAGNEFHHHAESHHTTLYDDPEFDGHHWGLAVDLNKCTGCSACVIACQSENNVAVVGKEEVHRRRIMHWIRLDRYYADSPEDPKVYHQPVMCQHCDNAPCENVCPVSATNHSNEGINQMSYNRCIGTKYCINNCPYRVRRFNWFAYVNNQEYDFHQNSSLGKMVLNPDVVVRERGVVEKCSFCVQRIQEKKMLAKTEERPVADGEIKTACVQACPSEAMVFGDLNDPESKVSMMFQNERNYHLLEELHTLPSVGYLTKVRNPKA